MRAKSMTRFVFFGAVGFNNEAQTLLCRGVLR
jgi:hypothetical protein